MFIKYSIYIIAVGIFLMSCDNHEWGSNYANEWKTKNVLECRDAIKDELTYDDGRWTNKMDDVFNKYCQCMVDASETLYDNPAEADGAAKNNELFLKNILEQGFEECSTYLLQ